MIIYYKDILVGMRRKVIKKNFWLSFEEDEQLKKLSKLLNMSEADTFRKLLFETTVKVAPPKEFYEAIEKMNKIGVNINQLTKVANTNGSIYSYELNKQFDYLNEMIEKIKDKYI